MNKIAGILLTLAGIVYVAGCTTPQRGSPDELKVVTESNAPAGVEQKKQPTSMVYHQTEEYRFIWVHQTKGEDEFQEDAASCRGTPEVIDAYLSYTDKEFMPLWMLPSAAFNKCMFSKDWKIEKQERTSEP